MPPVQLKWTAFRFAALAAVLLNLTALCIGTIYLVFARRLPVENLAGAAFILALFVNSLLGFGMCGPSRPSVIHRRLPFIYSAATPLILVGMLAGNFILSSRYEGFSAVVFAVSILVYGGFGAICALGAWSAIVALKAGGFRDAVPGARVPESTAVPSSGPKASGSNAAGTDIVRPMSSARGVGAQTGEIAALGLYGGLLGFAAFLGLLVLFGGRAGHALSWYAIFGATFSLFWGGVGLHASVVAALILNSKETGCRRVAGMVVSSVGVIVFVVHLLPAAAVPFYVQHSRQAFDALMDSAGPELRRSQEGSLPAGFKSRPFALTGYFLGIPRQRCEIRRDVLFFDGAEGPLPEERNLRLYFDAYLPPGDAVEWSSLRPVLIRLHGGGWHLGDKGLGNMMQMNRHFAAQGYAVFDVQYGLKGDPAHPPVITPTNVLGSFDLDDMMRHLGYFTRYLCEKAPEFEADLGAVFVSGGSAGGQLACALALALEVGEAPELFGEGITVLGLVPFYPANGVSPSWIGGQERWRNPEGLVRADSPPCLIFQGNQDGMVKPETSLRFCRAYRAAGNPACTVLLFPFAAHAADIYFPGYFNQVFLYYMERFLYAQR